MISLGCILNADDVQALLDKAKDTGGDYPDEQRFYSRDRAAAIIRAALWGYGCRNDSTSGAYAAMSLLDAIGLKTWCFDQEEADAINEFRGQWQRERAERRRVALSPAPAADEGEG